jgi:hypothetical protein
MLVAPLARWIPILSRPYIGDSGGKVVAENTGMDYTNVSMPLCAEGNLIAGAAGIIVVLGAAGRVARRDWKEAWPWIARSATG